MTVNFVEKIDNEVKIQTVLISVSDKVGLETFVPNLLQINPELRILSTGGTYARIQQILGDRAEGILVQVSDYTGQPETQGGLVKTLDFKIYLGLLTETYNEAHAADLKRTDARQIDMVVVNLYPFAQAVAAHDVTVEKARANIDIGGPCMVRASAKNYLRVASVTDPADYSDIIDQLKANNGALCLQTRYRLACKAFSHSAKYDATITEYLGSADFESVEACYQFPNKRGE